MDRQLFYHLLDRYLEEKISEAEAKELFALIVQPGYQQLLQEHIGAQLTGAAFDEPEDPIRKERIKTRLHSLIESERAPVRHINRFRRIAVAASLVIAVATGSYFLFFNKKTTDGAPPLAATSDVPAPHKNRAAITLADGRIIYLDSASNGTLTTISGVVVSKSADGKISYTGTNEATPISRPIYNTLTNPRGSKVIDVTLADGSRIWLNAGSSLKYPVAFAENERKVEITGEAYFEITHNAAKPFFVSKNDFHVEVLGTHFNVNAYDDEKDIKVTLLEGSVRVGRGDTGAGHHAVVIKPGEQASVANAVKVHTNADIEQVMAWKNGKFHFRSADIFEIMRQVARWYGVEVVYQGAHVSKERYQGKVSRDLTLSELIRVLELSKVDIRIEGKKLTITNH